VADLAGGRPGEHATTKALAHAGGWVGVAMGGGLAKGVGVAGALVIFFALLVVALIVTTGVGLRALLSGTATVFRAIGRLFSRWWLIRTNDDEEEDEDDSRPAAVIVPMTRSTRSRAVVEEDEVEEEEEEEYEEGEYEDEEEEEEYEEDEYEDDDAEVIQMRERPAYVALPSDWELPPLSLLQRTKDQKLDRALTDAAGEELVDALAAHGVETTLIGYTVGPTVTRFELELGAGVKVSRVTSLNKDIAYAMASPDVRILAPIPGRSAIGVEVPNRQRSLVALGDLLASDESIAATHPLDVPIGRDISGKTVVANLGEMPHILISGATGSREKLRYQLTHYGARHARHSRISCAFFSLTPSAWRWDSTTTCRTSWLRSLSIRRRPPALCRGRCARWSGATTSWPRVARATSPAITS
jgi:S-DNA-T family DNA segregation ATPase FtsK/SpoIIIE